MASSISILPASYPPEPYYSRGLRARYLLDEPKVLAETKAVYADIEYLPDKAKYLSRQTASLQRDDRQTRVPAGWPTVLQGPLAWKPADFKNETEFVHCLSEAEIGDIMAALENFKDQGLDGDEVNRQNFPLYILGPHLDNACDDIYNGRGFFILRGLEPNSLSAEDLTIVYLGISSYIAERRGKQDQRGSMLKHIMASEVTGDRNYDLPFHTDTVCDCLGLLTRSCSAKGGKSILASAWTVYNQIASTRPDLIHVLAEPSWPFDTFGRNPPYYRRALIYRVDGRIIINASRRLLTGHAPKDVRTKGIPGLTECQAEALDALHFIAQENQIKMPMQKGDIRFINNMGILHSGEAFGDDHDSKRHLVRLWLNNTTSKMWKLPEPLTIAWDRVFHDDERREHWDIEPPRNGQGIPILSASSCD